MLPLIVANWKMNGSVSALRSFYQSLCELVTDNEFALAKVLVCPPFTMLHLFSELKHSNLNLPILFGAQDCHHEKQGAYTGSVSAQMISEMLCTHVIVGHSERRLGFGETDDLVKQKASAAIESGLHPIICIGESLSDRANIRDVLLRQCEHSCPDFGKYTIAYEPVWAVGTKIAINIDVISETINSLKNHVSVPIIYGGSVNQNNAEMVASIKNISGLLIGGASLDAKHFAAIVKSVANSFHLK